MMFSRTHLKTPTLAQIKGAEPHLRFGQLCRQIHHDLLGLAGFRSSPAWHTLLTAPKPHGLRSKAGLKKEKVLSTAKKIV